MEKVLTVVFCHDGDSSFTQYYSNNLVKILANNPSFKLIADCHTGKDALKICPSLFPDFIIVDANIVDMDLYELVSQLMELCPTSEIITASISDSADYMQKMLQIGVRWYLSKPYTDWVVHETLISIDRLRKQSWFGD